MVRHFLVGISLLLIPCSVQAGVFCVAEHSKIVRLRDACHRHETALPLKLSSDLATVPRLGCEPSGRQRHGR
jgi:hypothetical protein